jgi:hypothetical protein
VSFLKRLFGGKGGDQDADDAAARPAGATEEIRPDDAPEESDLPPDPRQGATVWWRLNDPAFEAEREQMRVFAFEDRLMKALDASGAGTHDTNDLIRGFFAIRLLGPDADAIVEAIRPVLTGMPDGSYVSRRRGPRGTSEERVEL